jgi:hypothetical protein
MKSRVFSLGLLLSAAVFGQSWQTFIRSQPINPPPSGVTIIINHVQSGSDWVVAVKGSSSEFSHVNVTSATLGPVSAVKHRPVQNMTDLPQSFYTISSDSITLDLNGAPGNGFIVYAVVPVGLPVTCIVDGNKLTQKQPVIDSLMIRSGQVSTEPVSLRRAVYRLGHPEIDVSAPAAGQPDLITDRSGVTFALLDNVKRHILTRPTTQDLSVANCGCVRQAFVTFDIDERGSVAGVLQVVGNDDPAFQAEVSDFVRRFTFRPFGRQNQSLRVRSVVIVWVGRDGSVKTSLD